MASIAPAVARHRAEVGALSRSRTPDDPQLIDARRNLRVARAEECIRELVEGWPAPSSAQRDRLALLLRGGVADA